jgi:hypothetical protein
MKKGLFLAAIIVAASLAVISCKTKSKTGQPIASTTASFKPQCISSKDIPWGVGNPQEGKFWFGTEQMAQEAMNNTALMFGLTHTITSRRIVTNGMWGAWQYFGYEICGEPLFYE